MKILLIQPCGRYEGQPSMIAKNRSHALADVGQEVTLLTFDGVLGDWTEQDTKIKHVSFLFKIGIFTPVLCFMRRFLHFVMPFHLLDRAFDTFFTFLLALWQNRKQKFDVIHILDGSMPILSSLALASIVSNRIVVRGLTPYSRELDLRDWHKRFWSSLKNKRYTFCCNLLVSKLDGSRFVTAVKKFLYRRAVKRNRIAFVCDTKQVQESYAQSIFYDKMVYIPWGVETPEQQALTQQEARQYLGLPEDEKIFFIFGVHAFYKNYEVIFQAVHDLPQDFKLVFTGKQLEAENDPERLAQKYGWVESTIIVNKYIPEEELPYYFYAADAAILSYNKGFLGVSTVLLNTCQYSLPVIASDLGQVGEFVRDYKLGLTFTAEDPYSLREAIICFLNLSEEERLEMKKNLLEFASTHSWEQVTKQHLKLYQSLSAKDGGDFSERSIEASMKRVCSISEWLEFLLLNASKRVLPLFSPFQLRKLLTDCKSVLDLGCGDNSVLKLNFGEFYSVGVDIFEPALFESLRKGIHRDYIRADIRKLPVKQKSFDCVLALELIEHFTEEEGYELLKNIEGIARKRVIIATPNGFIQPRQEDRHGNIWQVHKSGWNVSQLRMLGYEVKGMAGLKLLRNHYGRTRFKPALAWRLISYLTQMVAYYLPQLSSDLFGTKEIKRKEEQ